MRHKFKKHKKRLVILVSALSALFLIFILSGSFPPSFVKKPVLFLADPFLSLRLNISDFLEQKTSFFLEKSDLQTENIFLKQKLMQLETSVGFCETVESENRELKEVFLREEENQFLLANVLSRPGYGIYNSLIIDVGEKDGVAKGMRVTAYGKVLLGYIVEVTPDISIVKLVSCPGEEINAFIGDITAAIVIGKGAENMSAELPKDLSVEIGDVVFTLDTNSLFLGVVEKIEKTPEDPFQEILFRLPVNIQEIRHVYLLK